MRRIQNRVRVAADLSQARAAIREISSPMRSLPAAALNISSTPRVVVRLLGPFVVARPFVSNSAMRRSTFQLQLRGRLSQTDEDCYLAYRITPGPGRAAVVVMALVATILLAGAIIVPTVFTFALAAIPGAAAVLFGIQYLSLCKWDEPEVELLEDWVKHVTSNAGKEDQAFDVTQGPD